ncbi:MAG: 50S ribosomal protein L32 [Myxococcota bacterium]
MAVPKKRMSKSKSRMRNSHQALRAPTLSPCPDCGEMRAPHRACPACGRYRGRQVFEAKAEDEV